MIIVDNYNNTYHRSITMKPVDVKSDCYAEYNVNSNEKEFWNLKSVIMLEFQSIKTFLLKDDMLLIGQKKFLSSAKQKNIVPLTWKNCWDILWKRFAKDKSERV